MKTLCLVMLIKNEGKIIERCLSSVKDIIDYYVIVDTGSTDNTIEKIKQTLSNIKGEIHHSKWVNFGYNRSELVKLAKDKSDYALLLDADMMLVNDNFDKNTLTADVYHLHYLGATDYVQYLLINNRLNWRYFGVTHEYIQSNEAKIYENLNTLKINHIADGNSHRGKFERDIELLKRGVIDEPNNARYHFYLGQSYKDLKQYERAIEYYVKSISLDHWEEEKFYSKYQIGYCYERLGNFDKAKLAYLHAFEYRPTRAEPLYRLAMLCRNNKEYQQADLFCEKALEIPYPKDLLFIEKAVYEYAVLFEKSISAYWVGKYQESYEYCKRLIESSNVNESIKITSRRNIRFSEEKLFGKVITSTFNREDALENLRDIYTVCNRLNVSIFPFAGTLLGIIREDNFIAHDEDMDFAIKLENYSSQLIKELVYAGFKFESSFGKLEKGYELRFIKRNIQIDIFFFYDKSNYDCTYYYDNNGKLYEVRYEKFELKESTFKNIKIQIPNNPEEFLRQQYGDDWRLPKKTFNYLTDTKNITKES